MNHPEENVCKTTEIPIDSKRPKVCTAQGWRAISSTMGGCRRPSRSSGPSGGRRPDLMVLLCWLLALVLGCVKSITPLDGQQREEAAAASGPATAARAERPPWARQLSEEPAARHRGAVKCDELRDQACCEAQADKIDAAGVTLSFARPGRVDGQAGTECAVQLQVLLHALHCTLPGATWSEDWVTACDALVPVDSFEACDGVCVPRGDCHLDDSESGRMTVCRDACGGIKDACGGIAGLGASEIGSDYGAYCLNLAAHVGGSWGAGEIELEVCEQLAPTGSFVVCGGVCVPRSGCGRAPCVDGTAAQITAREAAVGLTGWEPGDAAGCAAWMTENLLDPRTCDEFDIYAWQTHYTKAGLAWFDSVGTCLLYSENQWCDTCMVVGAAGRWSSCGTDFQPTERQSCAPWATCPGTPALTMSAATPQGCNESDAFNFDPTAKTDRDCVEVMEGCTDPTAGNYNSNANTDDGSCYPGTPGCTNPAALNYDALLGADVDDGSCDLNFCEVGGHDCDGNATCTYTGPSEYSCECNTGFMGNGTACTLITVPGCTNGTLQFDEVYAGMVGVSCDPENPDALCMIQVYSNYDPSANTEDGSCQAAIVGCTNVVATNYNESFTLDPPDARDPVDPRACIVEECSSEQNAACHVDASCGIVNSETKCACGPGYIGNGTHCDTIVYGCLDPGALNHAAASNVDDGSCVFRLDGCTVERSLNFNPAATHDDGSCIPEVLGCTDVTAVTYSADANKDDGSCVYPKHFCTCECDCKQTVTVAPPWEHPPVIAPTPTVTSSSYIHVSGQVLIKTGVTESQMQQAAINVLEGQESNPTHLQPDDYMAVNYTQAVEVTISLVFNDTVAWNPSRSISREVASALRNIIDAIAFDNGTHVDSTVVDASAGEAIIFAVATSSIPMWATVSAVDFGTVLANEVSAVAVETTCSATLGEKWAACNGACVPRGTCSYRSSFDANARRALDELEVSVRPTSVTTTLNYAIERVARPLIDNATAIAQNYSSGLGNKAAAVAAFSAAGISVPTTFVYDSVRPFALQTCIGSNPCTYTPIGSCVATDQNACAAADISASDAAANQAACESASSTCTGDATPVAASCGDGEDANGAACAVNSDGNACEVASGTCSFVAGYTPTCDIDPGTDSSAECPAGCTVDSRCIYTAEDADNGIVASCVASSLAACSGIDVDASKSECIAAGACTYSSLAPCVAADIASCSTADIMTTACTGIASEVVAACSDASYEDEEACINAAETWTAAYTPICDQDESTDGTGTCPVGCDVVTAGANADRASCEAAGKCTYTAQDTERDILESCVASDIGVCENVSVVANESTCLAAGACIYNRLQPCAATDTAICEAVDVSGSDTAADQASCEAAGRCSYTAADADSGVDEACNAMHDYVCSSPDATQESCTGGGGCTYTAIVPQGEIVSLVEFSNSQVEMFTDPLELSLMMWLRIPDPNTPEALGDLEVAVHDEITDLLQVDDSRVQVAAVGIDFVDDALQKFTTDVLASTSYNGGLPMAHVVNALELHIESLVGSDVVETRVVSQSSVLAISVRIDIETGSASAVESWTGNSILANAIAAGLSAPNADVDVTALWQGDAEAGEQPFVTAEFVWRVCSSVLAACANTPHDWSTEDSLDKQVMAETLFPGLNPAADTDAMLTLYEEVNVTTTMVLAAQMSNTCLPPDTCYPNLSVEPVRTFLADSHAVATVLATFPPFTASWGSHDVHITATSASVVLVSQEQPEAPQQHLDPCGVGVNLTRTSGKIRFSTSVCKFNCDCVWTIQCPPREVNELGTIRYYDDQGVSLQFEQFSTESHYDTVTIYDAVQMESTQLTPPMSGSVGPHGAIASGSPTMIVRFMSDASNADSNEFNASFSCGRGLGPVGINVTFLPALADSGLQAKELYSSLYHLSRNISSDMYIKPHLSKLLLAQPGADNTTELAPEYACRSRYDVYLDDEGACDTLVTSGMSCDLYFCATCMYAHYCDSACGFCEDVVFKSRRVVTPTYGSYSPREDLYSKAATAFMPWQTSSAPWTSHAYRRVLAEDGEACDAVQPPAHGTVGDCTDALPSGSTCHLACDIGYIASGDVRCQDGVLTLATCVLHDTAVRTTLVVEIAEDNILESHIKIGLSALLTGVAQDRIRLVSIDRTFENNSTITLAIASASTEEQTPALEAVKRLEADLMTSPTLTIGNAAPAASAQTIVVTYPTCSDTDVEIAGEQPFLPTACSEGLELLPPESLFTAVCDTAACSSSTCCEVPWYFAFGISDPLSSELLSISIDEIDVDPANIVQDEVTVVYGTGRVDIVVAGEIPRSTSSVEQNHVIEANVSLAIGGSLSATAFADEVVLKVLSDSSNYTSTLVHRYSRKTVEQIRSFDRSDYTTSITRLQQMTNIEVGVVTHLCSTCVATAADACASAAIGSGDVDTDRDSCESAADCTYTPADVGNNVAASCEATDLQTCRSVGIDATKAACTTGIESPTSGCTYVAQACDIDDFQYSTGVGDSSLAQMENAMQALFDTSDSEALLDMSIVDLRGSQLRTDCFDNPDGWLDGFDDDCATYVDSNYCTADGSTELLGTCLNTEDVCGPGHGNGWDPNWGTIQANGNSNGEHALSSCCGCGGGRLENYGGVVFSLALQTNYDIAPLLGSDAFATTLATALAAAAATGELGTDAILTSVIHDVTNIDAILRVETDTVGGEDPLELQALLSYNFQNSERLLEYINEFGSAVGVSAAFSSAIHASEAVRTASCCACECVDKIQDCDELWVPALWAGDGMCDEGQVLNEFGVVANLQCEKYANDLGDCDAFEYAKCDNVKAERCTSHVMLDGYTGTRMELLGCTDDGAPNFDHNARLDDGSCEPWTLLVTGCMDSDAFNYDPAANVDDDNCIPRVYGCTEVEAYNYVPAANTNDGSCVPTLRGCMDPESLNFDNRANFDDGSCDRDPCLIELDDCHHNATCFHSNVPGNYQKEVVEVNARYYDMSDNCVVLYNGTTKCGPNEYQVNIFSYNFTYTRVPYFRKYGVDEATDGPPRLYPSISDGIVTQGPQFSNGSTFACACNRGSIGNGTFCTTRLHHIAVDADSSAPAMAGYSGGTALSAAFDGSPDTYLTIPDYASGLLHGESFTVSFVAHFTEGYSGRWRALFSKGADAQDRSPALFMRPVDAYMRAFVATDGEDYCSLSSAYSCVTKTATRMRQNRIYHIVYVIEAGELSFYVDGALVSRTGLPTLSCQPGAMCTVDGVVKFCSSDRTGYGSKASDGSWYRIKPVDGCTEGPACSCEPADVADAVVREGPLYIGSDPWNDGVAGYIKAFSVHATALDADEISALFLDDLPIFGCIDPDAFNYNEQANKGDGSCIAKTYGCTDTLAENFDATANTDDGSCDLDPCTVGERQPESCIATYFETCSSIPYTANASTCTDAGSCTHTAPYSCTAIGRDECSSVELSGSDAAADQAACESASSTCTGDATPVAASCGDGEDANGAACAVNSDGNACEVASGTCSFVAGYTPTCDIDPGTDSSAECPAGCTVDSRCTYTAANGDDLAGTCVATDLVACAAVAVDSDAETCTSAGACMYVVPASCSATDALTCAAGNISLPRDMFEQDQLSCESQGECTYTRLHPLTHSCNVHATCSHVSPSNFTCECNDGYVGDGAVCDVEYFGCNIIDSINYNPLANVDDGSCIPIVHGCTDARADNFDPDANTDDNTCFYNECLFGTYNDTTQRGHNCDGNATCIYDGLGIFNCACNTGYIGNGTFCEVVVEGCMDATAFNYLPQANVDDGGCIASVWGCLDPLATNFDPLVNRDDGSCDINPCLVELDDCHEQAHCGHIGPGLHVCTCMEGYVGNGTFCVVPIYTCTYPVAVNYNPACKLAVGACVEDGSCIFPIYGCTDSSADNWNMNANIDDGSCLKFGCTIEEAANFVEGATLDDGSCLVYGCMDPTANNYDAAANRPANEECTYTVRGCTYVDSLNYNPVANEDDGTCIRIRRGCTHEDADNFDPLANIDDDTCTRIPCYRGDDNCHQNATCVHLGPGSFECTCRLGTVGNGTHCDVAVPGCMDPASFNYDPVANVENATCVDVVTGCTDETAFNFDPNANTDNSSCIPKQLGCTDMRALNYNTTANVDDGLCELNFCTLNLHNCSRHANCTYSARQMVEDTNCSSSPAPSVDVAENCFHTVAEAFSCLCTAAYIGNGYTCTPRILGCTNATAVNYDIAANTDDGTCIAAVEGCTNPIASNYLRAANIDDGSCIIHPCNSTLQVCSEFADCGAIGDHYTCSCRSGYGGNGTTCFQILGCTYPSAINYNPLATQDNASCLFRIWGCTDSNATNYIAAADVDDGSCMYVVPGCTYGTPGCEYGEPGCAYNYDEKATIDDGSCIHVAHIGCMDPTMFSFNSDANVHSDEACVPFVYGCTDSNAYNFLATANSESGNCSYNACETGKHLCDTNATCIYTGPMNYTCNCVDGYVGDGVLQADLVSTYCGPRDNHDCLAFKSNETNVTCDAIGALAGDPAFVLHHRCLPGCAPVRFGCTDVDAFNYSPFANIDDGSCVPKIYGCTVPGMFNYNESKNTNDGSCVPVVNGCTNITSANFNAAANTDDFSCVDPTRGWVYLYVASHASAMSWKLTGTGGAVGGSLSEGALLPADEYAVRFDGKYSVRHAARFTFGQNVLTVAAAGGNGWPGATLSIMQGNDDIVVQTLLTVDFGASPGKLRFGHETNITFQINCTHHDQCGAFRYCSKSGNCRLCGSNPFDLCQTRNDSITTPVHEVLERSRQALPAPNASGSVEMTTACPGKCEVFLGCTNRGAANYNASANIDDGTCNITGCTDTRGTNFMPEATQDDGTCMLPGCIDSTAVNFNSIANIDDGSCVPTVLGCTDTMGANYNVFATVDDGSCIIDPCRSDTSDCDAHAVCTHVGPGMHLCECSAGFVGNGFICDVADTSSIVGSDAAVRPRLGPIEGGTTVFVSLDHLHWRGSSVTHVTPVVAGLDSQGRVHNVCEADELRLAHGAIGFDASMLLADAPECFSAIRAPPNYVIRLTFWEWKIAGEDVLYVYDGLNMSSPLLGTFGEPDRLTFGTLYSLSGNMYLKFASQTVNTSTVWRADWTFIRNDSMDTERIHIPPSLVIGNASGRVSLDVSEERGVGTALVCCAFGERIVPGIVYNRTHMRCVSPRVHAALAVNFTVGFGRNSTRWIQWMHANESFQYYNATVTQVDPDHGDHNVSSLVELTLAPHLQAAVQSDIVTCRVQLFHTGSVRHELYISAQHATSGFVRCLVPPVQHAMHAAVDVALNGQQFTSSGVQFAYTPAVQSISPDVGPASGGTMLGVQGSGFIDNQAQFCRLHNRSQQIDILVPALNFNGSARVWCSLPSEQRFAPGTVLIVSVTADWCTAHASGDYLNTTVSADSQHNCSFGNHFSSRRLHTIDQFTVYEDPHVRAITGGGSHAGGDVLVLETHLVTNTPWIYCGFFSTVPGHSHELFQSIGTYNRSLDTVSCTLPTKTQALSLSQLRVEISLNGQQYTNDGNLFTLYDAMEPPHIYSVSPSSGPKAGGTLVTVVGSNLAGIVGLDCAFNGVRSGTYSLQNGLLSDFRAAQFVPVNHELSSVICLTPPNYRDPQNHTFGSTIAGVVDLQATNDGVYWSNSLPFTYLASSPAFTTASIAVAGVDVASSDSITIFPLDVVSVNVQSRDNTGMNQTQGSDLVAVVATPVCTSDTPGHRCDAAAVRPVVHAQVADLDRYYNPDWDGASAPGRYAATLRLTFSGDYELAVMLDGVAIARSPWAIHVRHGPPSLNATRVYGHGLVDARAGHSALFTIQARDKYNNNHTDARGPLGFCVHISSYPEHKTCSVCAACPFPDGDGVYWAMREHFYPSFCVPRSSCRGNTVAGQTQR
eukprot:COSAG02_NODE_10_length_59045_cov_19.973365_30_plen_5873_part_00